MSACNFALPGIHALPAFIYRFQLEDEPSQRLLFAGIAVVEKEMNYIIYETIGKYPRSRNNT